MSDAIASETSEKLDHTLSAYARLELRSAEKGREIKALREQLRATVDGLEAIANWQHDPMDTYFEDFTEIRRLAADALLNTLKGAPE